jgi:hypothetical protein
MNKTGSVTSLQNLEDKDNKLFRRRNFLALSHKGISPISSGREETN